VKSAPEPIVGPHQPVLRKRESLGELGVAAELTSELGGQLPRRLGDHAAHRVPAFRAADAFRAVSGRDRPARDRVAG
jgi:hypothetical protein